MTKRKVLIALAAIVGVAVCTFAGLYAIRDYPYRQNGKYYIPSHYSKLALPAELRYKTAVWDDINAQDSSLESAWFYQYDIATDADRAALEKSIVQSLKDEGFFISARVPLDTPDGVRFDATNSTLNMSVTIGYICDDQLCEGTVPGNGVVIAAMLPVPKAHLKL